MADIKHRLVIKTKPEIVYKAITTQEGLSQWWAKNTKAKAEVGFINVFTFGNSVNEMKVMELSQNKKVTWKCTETPEKEWLGTHLYFELEEKDDRTILHFAHADWQAFTDTYASCNYQWAIFMLSLKTYCETGTGKPS